MIGSSRILVVDDDPASCELVAYSLKPLGYQVATAPDGNRALNVGAWDDIALVILDVHMPHHDGLEVLAMLRERNRTRPLKVLALTGDESGAVRSAMGERGIDGFFTKPVDLKSPAPGGYAPDSRPDVRRPAALPPFARPAATSSALNFRLAEASGQNPCALGWTDEDHAPL